MRNVIFGGAFAALALMMGPAKAQDAASSIIGVWKVTGFTSKVADTGEIRRVYGAQPGGYLVYTRGGHAVLIIVGDGRKAPAAANPTDAERAELFKTFAAWSGTYRVEGGKVTVSIDVSWNQLWTGTDLVRSVVIDGETMTNTFTTKSVLDGKDVLNTVTYERVE
jgi:hypothetical protein